MSAPITNSIPFELRITPTKRKREELKERQLQHFNYGANKENKFITYNNCMEVKSISDLINPSAFEVVRKPPKKKDRKDVSDDNCFVNPALNLNVPEKIINPFEVIRAATIQETIQHCFENSGLNIRGEERQINPFEIARQPLPVEINKGFEVFFMFFFLFVFGYNSKCIIYL